MVKLQLLEKGLLFEAKGVDAIVSSWLSGNNSNDSELKHGEKDSIQIELLSNLLMSYYEKCIQEVDESCAVSSSYIRPALVEAYRRKVIEESIFGKCPSILCEHCSSYNPSLHVAGGGSTKLFEVPLSDRYTQLNDARKRTSSKLPLKREVPHEDEETDDSDNSDNSDDSESKTEEPISSEEIPRSYKFLTPFHIMERIKKLWANYSQFLMLIFGGSNLPLPLSSSSSVKTTKRQTFSSHFASQDYKKFFLEVIPVPPTKFRPPSIHNGAVFENPQNGYLTAILKASNQVINIRETHMAIIEQENPDISLEITDLSPKFMPDHMATASAAAFTKIVTAWIDLQEQVNYLYDSSKRDVKGGKIAPPGIKQVLEKKEGLFRKHMMGKRVNYAARSVISPDVCIETNEIGLPMVFATKLTYPEPVTSHNLLRLRQAVINGPNVHPGATHIQNEDGTLSNLALLSIEARTALANRLLTPLAAGDGNMSSLGYTHAINKRVLRHVRDGDALLLNRQPTLHKPSIMAHRCRILRGEKTIRMHYANCNTYNADFDGDEMNIHCPQSELGRAEAYLIANTDSQVRRAMPLIF